METKFCKFCGKEIDKDAIVCTKCGRQLKLVDNEKKKEGTKEEIKEEKFYEKQWFMWLTLIIFPLMGILVMWKFNKNFDKKKKIILTILFGIYGLIILFINNDDVNNNETSNKYETNEKVIVNVIDFSSMTNAEIDTWCNDNKINCTITEEYNDNIEKGKFISQSIESDKSINQGESIKIIFSLGKAPTKGQENALKSAKSYLEFSSFSKKGLKEQLEYEGYTKDEVNYAMNNINVDWKEQAVKSAKSYLAYSSFSKKSLIEQLEYEGFTHEQAVYGVEQNGL